MIKDKKAQVNKENLVRSLGVFELRGLAREVGIASPTTKKREELIALILEKLGNGEQIDVIGPRRGRPHKQLNTLTEIVNNMGIEDKNIKIETYESVLFFYQEEKPLILGFTDEVGEFEGYTRFQEKECYIIDYATGEKVFIENSELPEGVLIKVRANRINGSKLFCSTTILEIENSPVENFEYIEFDKGDETLSKDTLSMLGGKVSVGRRNTFCYQEDLFENDLLETFQAECEQKNHKFLLLSLNTPYENMLKYKLLNQNLDFTTEYASKPMDSFNKLIDLINRTQYLSNKGENVVIFVPDVLDIARKLDEVFCGEDNDVMGHAQRTIIVMQKLFALGKAYENGGNVTLVMGYNEAGKEDKFVSSDILRISKKIN